MTNRSNPVRRYSRFPVRWAVLYGNEELLAEGTVLDVTTLGWRLAGSIPVVPGMPLTLQVSIPVRSTPLRIERATVLWVKDQEFAIEVHDMAPIDRAWVEEFLRQKLGLMWISRAADHETSVHPRDGMIFHEAARTEDPVPSMEDPEQGFSALHTNSTDVAGNNRGDGDSVFEEEASPSGGALPDSLVFDAHRIIRGIHALKTARARTGRDPIAYN